MPVGEVSSDVLEVFKSINALREQGNSCYLNFTCFLQEDVDYLNLKCDELGGSLAEKIRKETGGQIPLAVRFDEVSYEKYLYFIIGCVCLDWHGLKILQDLDLILNPSAQRKSGYGSYCLYANENVESNIKELYWGSHNYNFGEFSFTTFGDHSSQRLAFPDILIINPSHDLFRKVYFNMIGYYMARIGNALIKKAPADGSMIEILTELKYLKDGKLNIPVLVSEDAKNIRRLTNIIDEIIKDWLAENSGNLKSIFSDLTPLKFGVDFKEVLIQTWHYVFGHANKHLSRIGYFFNPYSDDSDFSGYLPVVYESQ